MFVPSAGGAPGPIRVLLVCVFLALFTCRCSLRFLFLFEFFLKFSSLDIHRLSFVVFLLLERLLSFVTLFLLSLILMIFLLQKEGGRYFVLIN